MIALMRYQLATMLHGQRYLAPVLLFLALLSVFTINDQGSLSNIYVVCASAVLVCTAWLTITLLNAEDPVHRAITIVNANGSRRVLLAGVQLALLLGLALTAVGTVFPLESGRHPVTGAGLLLGVEAQVVSSCVGVGIGLLCSRLMIRRSGYSLIAALVLVAAVSLIPGLPPVNPMLRLMSDDRPAATLVPAVSGFLLVGVLLLAVTVIATHAVTTRRD